MPTIKEWAERNNGLAIIIRRHLQSREAPILEVVSEPIADAFRYARMLQDSRQGLSAIGTQNAFQQGVALANMSIMPGIVVTGTDQRNIDGGVATVEGIESVIKNTPVLCATNPGVAHPSYGNLEICVAQFERHGNYSVHRHLSGRFPETCGMWVETVAALRARLMGAIHGILSERSSFGLEFWDLNYEQMILLFQVLIRKKPLSELDIEPNTAYECNYGAGFVVAQNGEAMQFTSSFMIGPSRIFKE